MLTRSDVLHRARNVWPMHSVSYSQNEYHQPDGYRTDCSGFASMAWHLDQSYNTTTLLSHNQMYEIPFASLLPGDALGLCGPGTEGNVGHIQIVTAPLEGTSNRIIEQAGGMMGPDEYVTNRPSIYRAYRCVRVADALPLIHEGSTGSSVALAQTRLNVHGAMLAIDGDFGPLTDAATRSFQRAQNIDADGWIGPITWALL